MPYDTVVENCYTGILCWWNPDQFLLFLPLPPLNKICCIRVIYSNQWMSLVQYQSIPVESIWGKPLPSWPLVSRCQGEGWPCRNHTSGRGPQPAREGCSPTGGGAGWPSEWHPTLASYWRRGREGGVGGGVKKGASQQPYCNIKALPPMKNVLLKSLTLFRYNHKLLRVCQSIKRKARERGQISETKTHLLLAVVRYSLPSSGVRYCTWCGGVWRWQGRTRWTTLATVSHFSQ